MKISVVICTYNRAKSLATTLDSLAAQQMPDAAAWEAIVVDNNSTDQTREVAESYCRRHPGLFRYVFEGQQGLSRARNAGIRAAQGEIVVFTDDDIIAEPTWLNNLTAPLAGSEWAGGGGRVVPPQDLKLPEWLTVGGEKDLVGALLPIFDLGNEAGEMKRPPYGANMAFRKNMFEKYGTFRVDLGHCGGKLVSGEDVDFGNRLIAAGERLRYEPSAVVHHPVPEERLTKRYFRAWWFGFGQTRIIERGVGAGRGVFSLGNLFVRHLPSRVLRWMFSGNAKDRFYHECEVQLTMGEIVQTCAQLRQRGEAMERIPSKL
jgi:glycosyltransferase involved in cell wall biosynthesis